MAILPTAHATQRFGSRAIDFYVAPGQVIGSDPRARADERRIQDLDGERHPVRIGKRSFALDAGDYAAVIRLQPGPKRRSRPVAVVNYRTGSWTRTSQDNTSLLASSGVSRSANWFLTVLAMVALSLLIVWPQLVALVGILTPGLAASLPVFDIFTTMAALQPGLADARLTQAAPGLADAIGAMAPQMTGFEGAAIFAGLTAIGAVIAFAARSWRFAWVPVFLALVLAAAIAVNGLEAAAIPALLALAGSVALFIVAGLINRWRDAARLEARIARLADHVLRHPPQEMVTRRDMPATFSDEDAAETIPAPANAAPEVAPLAAAAISAREAVDASAAPGEANGDDTPASSGDVPADAPAADAAQADMPEAESAATDDIPDDIPSEDDALVATGAASDGATTHDARAEARSMDIAPPPPMPVQDTASSAERVNRDAEPGEADPAALTGPVVTETRLLQPDAAVEAGGIPASVTDDAGQDGDSDAGAELAGDDPVSSGDSFGGSENAPRRD